ncbi:O-antigen ligase family protein [Paenibacillus nasutitermitis]|uniref:O-antigen ligase-related domain-containing protein n=1 Tax=Paenibacillus nasutitermitis TaxID=1652958 RepID=A0A917DWT0_9BACL|nr:O-antigen ligase family protein [Paenibacillus nasutitermitis]GGD76227.1 hypothetical protein GCM10010911_37830 [Paenibacillus nasutitermitis]
MNFLIYIAAFLFPLDNFPIMFGAAYKPISLVFIALFFAFNFPHILKLSYKKTELCVLIIVICSIVVTCFRNIEFHYSFVGMNDALSSLLAGLVIYLSFKVYVQRNSEDGAYIKLFKWIIRGYGLALVIGVLQLLFIYVLPSGALRGLIGLFVERTAYIQAHRLHFSFSEPSYIGLHTNLLLIPAYLILRHTNNLSRYDKWIVFLFIPISIFSLSIRYFVDLTILYLVYVFATSKSKDFMKVILKFAVSAGVLFLLLQTVLVQNVFNLESSHYYRILHLYEDPSKISKDDSFSIRITYSKLGIYSFGDKPWLGYGLGNYYYGYMNHLDKIPARDFKKDGELYNATNHLSLPQYNMYTRLLSEFGVMGIALFLFTAAFILSFKGRNFSKMILILLLVALLQFDSLAFIQLFFWLALLQSPFISKLQIYKLRASKVAHAQQIPNRSSAYDSREGSLVIMAKQVTHG